MANLGQFITALAEKAGVPSDHKGLIDILSNSELAKATVSEDLVQSLNEGLTLTFESAMNNQKIKNHFFTAALNGMDAELATLASDLDDEGKAELAAEKSTFKKVGILTNKIKDLEAKKAQASYKDKPDLTSEINKLQKQIADTIKAGEDKVAEIKTQHQNELTNLNKDFILAKKKFANREIPQDTNIQLSKLVIENDLKTKGAKVITRDGKLVMVQASDESLDYYENGTKPSVEDYFDGVLAQNKLLAVSDPNPAPVGGQGFPSGQQFNPSVPAGEAQDMSNIIERLQNSRKDFATHSTAVPA
jgi:hypothetical protein